MNLMRSFNASAVLCGMMLTGTSAASAQDQSAAAEQTGSEPDADNQSAGVEEIVVTAERRSQNLQDVPMSIQAFSAESLAQSGTGSNMDLQTQTTGLVMTENSGFGQIYIRGIGSDVIGAGVDNAVAVYIDGVYQSRPAGSALAFVDVERVEVLKGPQGTLYGRNATGGAINIISKSPSNTLEGDIQAELGSYRKGLLRGTVSGPLSASVAARLSFLANKNDGYTKNTLLDTRGNDRNERALRAALEINPSDALQITLNGRFYDSDTSPMLKSLNTLFNVAYTAFNATQIADPLTVRQNVQSGVAAKQAGADATVKYEMDDLFLSSVTAVRKEKLNIKNTDTDATEIDALNVGGGGSPENSDFFSQDLTMGSNSSGPIEWTALASYMHQKTDYNFAIAVPVARVRTLAVGTLTTEAFGVGGQATYSLTSGLSLTAGVRFSQESKKHIATNAVNGTVTRSQNAKETWTAWTPRFVAKYSVSDNTMLYASYSKGFKSGGYNTLSIGEAWQPERVANSEVGFKSTLLDGRLHVSADAFISKYDNLQLQFTNRTPAGALVAVTTNAAKATSKGIEANVDARPTKNFFLTVGVQLLHGRFDNYVSTNPLNPAPGAVDQKGNPLLRAPDVTVNFALQYTWPAAIASNDLTFRFDGYHRSRIYYTAFADPIASEKLNFLGNVQLSFESPEKLGLYGAVFVRNITDKIYHTDILASSSAGYVGYVAPPRTFGAQLGYRF
jgi:iron complex outermembrane receptor protein